MVSPGGYQVTPGLYRVPDLLTEEQFVDYMWNTYRRKVTFTDNTQVNTDRALGRTAPMGVLDEDAKSNDFRDPVLRRINEMDFSAPSEKLDNEPKKTSSTSTKSTSK